MHLTIATAGHIDHGKSALVEALTGTHPDRLPEEKARGISIELGFAHATVDDVVLSFVDVPGHERFVRTMLGGIGGIDAVLLVVAADESVMPQTREHLAICGLLDVPGGVIALTKCDVADDTMQAVAEDDVRELVEGTALSRAPIVRVSARTGQGIAALRTALLAAAASRRTRERDVPPRLPVDRVFSVKGFGTVVTGTLWTGSMAIDASLRAWPSGRSLRVRGLQVHGAAAPLAEAGQRVAVNLAGVSVDEVSRGDVLVGEGVVVPTRRLSVDLRVLPDVPPLRHGTRVHVHLSTAAVLARVLLPAPADGQAGRVIAPGASAAAMLRLEGTLAARRGDRLVLRSYSPVSTIAGAVVVDPAPPLRARLVGTSPATDDLDLSAMVAARVAEAGASGCVAADLPARCAATVAATAKALSELEGAGRVVRAGDRWVSTGVVREVRDAVLARLDADAAADPMAGGVPRAALRQAFGRRTRPEVVDLVLDALAREGLVTGDERVRRTSGGAAREAVDVRVLARLDGAGTVGASLAELETAEGLDRKVLAAVLARLVKARDVERVADQYIASRHLAALVADLRALRDAGAAPSVVEVGWFKDRYGLTRRTAIPLLEWLDRTRVTRRTGEARVLIAG
ncbi:selenocysteine-specific translation factor [Luteitalea sp. TBR-22]|uniref:selenocysteine-specific translation elongation factor n=1 Tax=Luteitalea sp. TBR-22 TaxID=2802971 RepID=UPI001AF62945|nr:selenocysteine-specific translation elongation factor [Luteitalea sp. TBR-22]BCS33920.1 selenocysteine-specific translation factor [Luteitalea sp. TBR-22]